MKELITEYKEIFEGIPWHSESIMESIDKVPLEYYDKKLEGAHHTIGELIQHMIDWRIFVMEKIKKNDTFHYWSCRILKTYLPWMRCIHIPNRTSIERKENNYSYFNDIFDMFR